MKYDLLLTDFDGTLGEAPDIIKEDTVKAIKDFINKGGKFGVVTGRLFSSIDAILSKYGLNSLEGCSQGACIYDGINKKQLFYGGIDYNYAYKIVEKLQEDGITTVVFIDDTFYYQEETPYVEMYRKTKSVKMQKADLLEVILKSKKPVLKINACCKKEERILIQNKYEKIFDKVVLNSGSHELVEFINPKFGKDFAVKYIAEYFNVPLEKVLVVGDSNNDILLLKGAWHGVAVGDGDEQLKKIAKEVTVPYSEQPIKYLLNKYCL